LTFSKKLSDTGNAENLEKVNATLERKMQALQESNEKRLEQMQGVVDEKL
jgi:DNA anti-recombination protein RmuC